jgi:hypothetical protein
MSNLVKVPVSTDFSMSQRVNLVVKHCEGKYIGIISKGLFIKEMWIENPLYALTKSQISKLAFEVEGSTEEIWGAAVKRDDLLLAHSRFPNLSTRESLKAVGFTLRPPNFEELPFIFDKLLLQAQSAQNEGNWLQAANGFECIGNHHKNELWMNSLAAKAFFEAGEYTKSAELCRKLNTKRPTVDTLLLEAKIKREHQNYDSAINLLRIAEQIITNNDGHASIYCSAAESNFHRTDTRENENFYGTDSVWT